ncbi:MAG: DUF2586 family protein [bacterium]|nr:DUF2586 family protein [bacterium]
MGIKRVSGISAQLANSGELSPPTGFYGKLGWITQAGSLALVQAFNASSDEASIFSGETRLIAELTAARLNGGARTNLLVNSGPAGHLDAANLGSRIDEVLAVGEVEGLVLDTEADAAFLDALKNELASRSALKEDFFALTRFRKAYRLDLSGAAAVDNTGGLVGIPALGHPLAVGDTVILSGTANYDGTYVLDASTGVDELVITATFTAETFAADSSLEEQPESYLAAFKTACDAFSSPKIAIVAPTTQDGHLGALAGAVMNVETLAEDAGMVMRHSLLGVSLDNRWSLTKRAVIDGLAEARAVVLKRHKEDPTGVYINLGLTLAGPLDDQEILPLTRIAHKVLREARLRAFPAVNSHEFPLDQPGANAIAMMATAGFPEMKRIGELTRWETSGSWNADGSLSLTISAQGPNHVPVITETITLTPDQGV